MLGVGKHAASAICFECLMFNDADGIDRIAKVAGDVEPVEADLPVCAWNLLKEGVYERSPHIHGDRLDGLLLALVERPQPRQDRLFLAVLQHL